MGSIAKKLQPALDSADKATALMNRLARRRPRLPDTSHLNDKEVSRDIVRVPIRTVKAFPRRVDRIVRATLHVRDREDSMEALKCPVCQGKQVVERGFYDDVQRDVTATEKCRSCDGKGYVVAPEPASSPSFVLPMPFPVYPHYYHPWQTRPSTTGAPQITWASPNTYGGSGTFADVGTNDVTGSVVKVQ